MEMTRTEYRKLVDDIAAAVVQKVLPFVKKKRGGAEQDPCTWITPKEAAGILGISIGHLYQIKHWFTCIKSGTTRRGPLRFRKETLVEEYIAAHPLRTRLPKVEAATAAAPGTAETAAGNADETARAAAPPKGAEI